MACHSAPPVLPGAARWPAGVAALAPVGSDATGRLSRLLLCAPCEVASQPAGDALWPALPSSAPAASMASSRSSSPEAAEQSGEGAGDMFRALLEASEDVFAVISTENGFLYLSPSVQNLLGFEPCELLG